MGVKGLWPLLEPTARRATLDSLHGKRLAIDASIWLHQFIKAIKDSEGNVLPNAHLLGFLRRICKLLFHGIKPIFVFDGRTPDMKRHTVARREKQREQHRANAKRTAEKILSAQLRLHALNQTTGARTSPRGGSKTSVNSDAQILAAQIGLGRGTEAKRKRDTYDLDEIGDADRVARRLAVSDTRRDDLRFALQSELASFVADHQDEVLDIDSDVFRALPLEMQHEIVLDMKNKSRQTSWDRFEELVRLAPTAFEFSQLQIKNLVKRNDLMQNYMKVSGMDRRSASLKPGRVSGERSREYILVRNDGAAGGWSMSTRAVEETADVDVAQDVKPPPTITVVDSSDEDDFEDVDMTVRHPVPTTPAKPENLGTKQMAYISDSVGGDVVEIDDSDDDLAVISELTDWRRSPAQSLSPAQSSPGPVRPGSALDSYAPTTPSPLRRANVAGFASSMSHDAFMRSTEIPTSLSSPPGPNTLSSTRRRGADEVSDGNAPAAATVLRAETEEDDDPLAILHGIYDGIRQRDRSPESPIRLQEAIPEGSVSKAAPPVLKPVPEETTEVNWHALLRQSVLRPAAPTSASPGVDYPSPSDMTPPVPTPMERDETMGSSAPTLAATLDAVDSDPVVAEPPAPVPTEVLPPTSESVPTTHSSQHQPFSTQARQQASRRMARNLATELTTLRRDQSHQARMASVLDSEMVADTQILLRLFGLPFVTAPTEAEAECAQLVHQGLADGIATDDSDVFLFGGTRVYRHMFNQQRYIELYNLDDLAAELVLDRDRLIDLAYLLGSDYTEGIPGVGLVTALEILGEFNDLTELRQWWDRATDPLATAANPLDSEGNRATRDRLRKLAFKTQLPPEFPDPRVREAYKHPAVSEDPTTFQWAYPDLDALRDYLAPKLSWSRAKLDDVLVPVTRRMFQTSTTRTGAAVNPATTNTSLLDFFNPLPAALTTATSVSGGGPAGRSPGHADGSSHKSGRIRKIIAKWKAEADRRGSSIQEDQPRPAMVPDEIPDDSLPAPSDISACASTAAALNSDYSTPSDSSDEERLQVELPKLPRRANPAAGGSERGRGRSRRGRGKARGRGSTK
ncbi:DNA repair protein rad2 [Tieghemiomyces parasiticus]|uniref:DNA repair protein rad2 n=1 Tax=Tieghemiomyces parasiticus TaxID=78921 RepID=A0A9W8DMN2_9FUNG|nr:DNA repair protein rad2 [Tieghemiomyces parasiticus]